MPFDLDKELKGEFDLDAELGEVEEFGDPPNCAKVRRMIREGGHPRLVVLNMGLGRDSMSMLSMLKHGELMAEGRPVYPEDLDAIVFSDTGTEFEHSIQVIPIVQAFAKKIGVPFYWLKKPPKPQWQRFLKEVVKERKKRKSAGYRGVRAADAEAMRAWRRGKNLSLMQKADRGYYHLKAPLLEDYQSRGFTVPKRMDIKDCTVKHKVDVIRRFMNDLGVEKFGMTNAQWGSMVKKGLAVPHLNLIGFDLEEGRADYRTPCNPKRTSTGPWWVTEAFPLVESKITREDEKSILSREKWKRKTWNDIVFKSGCFICPWQRPSYYYALRELSPPDWRRAVKYQKTNVAAGSYHLMSYKDDQGQKKFLPAAVEHWLDLFRRDEHGNLMPVPTGTPRKHYRVRQSDAGRYLTNRSITPDEALQTHFTRGKKGVPPPKSWWTYR
jgi:hypothetical protein